MKVTRNIDTGNEKQTIRTISTKPKEHFEGRWKSGRLYPLYSVVVNNGTTFISQNAKMKEEPYVIYDADKKEFKAPDGWLIKEMSADSRVTALGGGGEGGVTPEEVEEMIKDKVDKVDGKGLSTNDYNNTEKNKVASAYQKPNNGIPKSDLAKAVQDVLDDADGAYKKPVTGIPFADLADGVQDSLSNADEAKAGLAGKQDTISDLSTIRSGAAAGATSVQPAEFNELKDEVDTIGNGAYEEAWDGDSTPVVADIPAGVVVTYSSTSYTGTLAASASTVDKIYLVSDGNGNYDRYTTVEANGAYSWKKVGSTAIPLSNYATKTKVNQLEAKVDDISTGKYYGYFATSADLPDDATVDGFAYVGEGPTYTIYNLRGGVWTSSDITVNQSPIGNDEDIDQNENGKLRFANRTYNSLQPNGMGYKILRKDATFASQVTDTNTIYEIRYPFDLNDTTVNIPSGCTLRFNGGSLSNGSIVYNNTEIQGEPIIGCTCTGSLRNSVVTPQMYGAKVDGITDDNVALNNAAKYNDCVFFPAGKYITTQPISMHSGLTIFGVGEESKIENPTYHGYNKICINTGALTVGNNTGSFLELTAYSCTISSDRYSVLVPDTSPFKVGDLVYICKDESYTTKNPTYFWVGKIVDITENTSLKLDYYIGNDSLVGVNCLVRDLATLPTNTDKITENICVHDLNLSNSNDDGSGMYVFELASYGAKIYNIWAHGNTIVGANFLVNATIRNLTAEFDGGFLDIPEVSQNVEVSDCRAKRFGVRQNVIGMSFLAGYGVIVQNNNIDFGGSGKVGFSEHIKASIKNNVFLNLLVNSGRPVELSKYGNTIFEGNTVSSSTDTSIINPGDGAEGHIIKDNYIDNPNTVRWIEGYLNFKFNKNCVKGNLLTHQNDADAYYNAFPDTTIATSIPVYGWPGTVNMAAGLKDTAMDSTIKLTNSRIVRLSFMAQLGSYTITLTGGNGGTTAIPLTNGTWIDIFILGASNYVNVRRDGDAAGAARYPFNSHGYVKKIEITNNTAEARQIYYMLIKPEVE